VPFCGLTRESPPPQSNRERLRPYLPPGRGRPDRRRSELGHGQIRGAAKMLGRPPTFPADPRSWWASHARRHCWMKSAANPTSPAGWSLC
jgi:hypothetical protein